VLFVGLLVHGTQAQLPTAAISFMMDNLDCNALNPGQDAGLKAQFEHKIIEAVKAAIPAAGTAIMGASVMKCGPTSLFKGGISGALSSLRRLNPITSAFQSLMPLSSGVTVPGVSGALAANAGLPSGLASAATNYLGAGSPAIQAGGLSARGISASPGPAPTTTESSSASSDWLLGLLPLLCCCLLCCCLLAAAAAAAMMMGKKKKKKKKVARGDSSSSWDEVVTTQADATPMVSQAY